MIAAIPLITSALSSLSSAGSAAAASTGSVQNAASANGDFSQVLQKISSDAMQNIKGAETLAVDGIEGKANVQDVVQSVMSAQETLQTALAIRDKSVSAFQEITRMAI